MASNSSLNLTSLDFDTLKSQFKTFLKSQSVFKDYDFDASNINVLLDVMSYNSYLNAFYLNMTASEMFLDSAQRFDSIVSHAKELNYTPRSAHAAAADVSFTLETQGIAGKLTIPKGTKFSGINSNGNFNFVTDRATIYVSANTTYTVNDLRVREGLYFQESFVIDRSLETQKLVLSNKNIDVGTMTVSVVEDNGATNTVFTRAETLFGLNSTSPVYFLQGSHNNQYEIIFGDGYFGRIPKDGAMIMVDYIITKGSDGNGVAEMTLLDDLGDINFGAALSSDITVDSSSSGGANQESIESVRFAAPRYFATQQRAVSSDDYSSLILNNFGGEISDVAVFGGETMEPKQYGRVVVSLKPATGTIAPDYVKSKISNFILEYVAVPNRVIVKDPDYLYCSVQTEIQYDPYVTNKTVSEINTIALNAITGFSQNNVERFNNDLRYSKLVNAIDDSDTSITSNQTELRIVKRISPKLNFATDYSFDIGNVIYYEGMTVDAGIPHTELYTTSFDTHVEHASLISSRFTAVYNSTEYPLAYIADDGAGNIKLYATIKSSIYPLTSIGTIDYATGQIIIQKLEASSYINHISIYIRSRDLDIFASQNKIIIIDPSDVDITVTETRR